MGFGKDITGMLPPEFARLLKDDEAVKDLLTILGEVQPVLDAARKNPATDAQLQQSLGDIINVLSLGKSIVEKKGKVGFGDVPRAMGIAANAKKYQAMFEDLGLRLQAGDETLTGIAATLARNTKLIEAVERVGPKTQTPERQALLADPEIRKDLLICLVEAEKAIDAVRKDAKTEKSLKDAFNDVAEVASVAHTYLEKGSLTGVSPDLLVDIALNSEKYSKSGQVLSEAFKSENPTIVGLQKSMRENTTSLEALKRIVPKTHGELFRLEVGADGQGYAVELVSGGNMKFALDKVDFDEIKRALEGKPAPKQKPGPKPGV